MQPVIAASPCFVSFGWGMVRHFSRAGKPTGTMMLIAGMAIASAGVQIFALIRLPMLFPFSALTLYAVSAVLFWWAVSVSRRQLAACGQRAASGRIIRSGPYRSIRHPFYLSYNLTWIAGFAATGWWPVLVSAAAMAWMYDRSAREEERGFLAGPLAREYADYTARAGRYLPTLRSWMRAGA